MIVLYTPEEMKKQRFRARWSGAVSWGALALGWIACAVLCFFVRTANAKQMLFLIIALATVSGWVFILLRQMVYLPALAELRHISSMLNDTPEMYEGILRPVPGAFKIPHGITVRRVELLSGADTVMLNIDAKRAGCLPAFVTTSRVLAVRKFITAIEVLHE